MEANHMLPLTKALPNHIKTVLLLSEAFEISLLAVLIFKFVCPAIFNF
jgi:hypothetical protein